MFLPGESHGRRSLVGCSPWGRTESDTTEATWQQKNPQETCNVLFYRRELGCWRIGEKKSVFSVDLYTF